MAVTVEKERVPMSKPYPPKLRSRRHTTVPKVCETIQRQARFTSDTLGVGVRDADFSPAEPTLTEQNLIEIALRHKPWVQVHKFSQWEESRTGGDWIWWVGGFQGWIGLQIQAKKLDLPTMSYRELAKLSSLKQNKTLIKDAANKGAIPLYCFYSSLVRPSHVTKWPNSLCCRWPSGVPDPLKLAGCTLLPAQAIGTLADYSVKTVQALAVPWDCIFCCSTFGATSAATRVAGVFDRLSGLKSQTDSERLEFVEGAVADYVRSELPGFINELPSALRRTDESAFAAALPPAVELSGILPPEYQSIEYMAAFDLDGTRQ